MGGGSNTAAKLLEAAFQAEIDALEQSDNFVEKDRRSAPPPAWRAVELLARRLARSTTRLEAEWISCCAARKGLAAEHPAYPDTLRRIAAPLIGALGASRRQSAELHAIELFNALDALSFETQATLQVVECLAEAASNVLPGDEYRVGCQELARFLTCVAVDVVGGSPSRGALEQSTDQRIAGPLLRHALPELVGVSAALCTLREQVMDLARAPGALLIAGESGTGKELVAQALHRLRSERGRPLLAVNCSALPRELIESELFGHERGAFTGSQQSSPGLLRAAEDGTVFLDEVTEMPLALQPKLLRALEQRAVRPVGGLKELPIRARIVAATNRDPEQAVASGQLRADLFYRLCVHRIDVPALRERLDDIPLLVTHFLQALNAAGQIVPRGFHPTCLTRLMAHDWPGNIRELRNVVEHCSARVKSGEVLPEHLPRCLQRAPNKSGAYPTAAVSVTRASGAEEQGTAARAISEAPPAANDAGFPPLQLVERAHIERALRACHGNKTQAAQMLGVSRHQLYLRLERLGLSASSDAKSGRPSR